MMNTVTPVDHTSFAGTRIDESVSGDMYLTEPRTTVTKLRAPMDARTTLLVNWASSKSIRRSVPSSGPTMLSGLMSP
jgi:hypothetical protein